MNSINGLTVLKNSFSWKFNKYPRFHKKVKLQLQEKSEPAKETLSWSGGDDAGPGLSPRWQFECERPPPAPAPAPEPASDIDDDYSSVQYSSIDLDSDGPLYENTIGYPDPLLLSYDADADADEDDHIYDYVAPDCSAETRPADIFLSLVNGEGTAISPDPNIYEVPPGAIFNADCAFNNVCNFDELFPLSDISPPSGFQDKLTWERLHLIANNEDEADAIYSLPIKLSLNGSSFVRQRKKKQRPRIEDLLNQITMKTSADDKDAQQTETKDLDVKLAEPESVVSNEVVIENISAVVPNSLTVLQPVESADTKESSVTKEFTSVIEISGDGTWNTATLPADQVELAKPEAEGTSEDFLTSSTDARAKHVTLAYSGQYYTGNCPVASIKPMKHEEDTKKNIGAQIMERYEEERKKIIETKNLPDVSLLDVDESLEEIQKERRKIIESQAVRAKRIDSWITGREEGAMDEIDEDPVSGHEQSAHMHSQTEATMVTPCGNPKEEPSEASETTAVPETTPTTPETPNTPETQDINVYLDENGFGNGRIIRQHQASALSKMPFLSRVEVLIRTTADGKLIHKETCEFNDC